MPEPVTQSMVIWVPGKPEPERRPRASTFRVGTKQRVRMYVPVDADPWKHLVTRAALESKRKNGWVCVPKRQPVSVSINFHFHRPTSLRKSAVFKATKPDRDNLDKAVLDALAWASVFQDDSQVVDGRIRKLIDDQWQGALITVASGDYLNHEGYEKRECDGKETQ